VKSNRGDLVRAGDLAFVQDLAREPMPIRGPGVIKRRLLDGVNVNDNDSKNIVFQHTVLCQTCIPFRNPGDAARTWERLNGDVHLEVNAGKAMHPAKGRLVEVGLPFGPKARMILMHINQQALQEKSPEIHIDDTLSRFVHRTLNLDPNGRNMRSVKEQLARLAAASIRLGFVKDGRAVTVNSQIVTASDIWFQKDERQRVLWPSTIRLSLDYWESLKAHAVPLNEDHIARLSHSALALDIYSWLAQRLHRIRINQPVRISWLALHGQFGQGYTGDQAVKKFRSVFRVALRQVLTLYRGARITDEPHRPAQLLIEAGNAVWREQPAEGLILHNSPPPVPTRIL
jgi:hypothetical protein